MKQEVLRPGMVQMPIPTLNAMKSLLFNENGVDVSAIVNDISPDESHKDLTAINVALVMMGKTPNIGKTKYRKSGNILETTELTHFSLIMGIVSVKISYLRYNSETKVFQEYGEPMEHTMDYSEWSQLSDDRRKVLDEFQK